MAKEKVDLNLSYQAKHTSRLQIELLIVRFMY